MLAQQFRESSSLFDSLDAVRHWRALLLLAVSFMAALALWTLGGWLMVGGTVGWALLCVCAGVGGVLLLWMGNAAGILMMDEVSGQPSRGVGLALRAALGATQQLVLVLLALALVYLLGLLALTVVLLVCSIPVIGPWLYALVFPLAVVASGVALCVLPVLVFPLCAPALWRGLDASTGLAQLWAVVRQRLSLVLTWMLVLACIASVVWTVLLVVLLLGFSMAGGVSATVLGAQGLLWPAIGGLADASRAVAVLGTGMAPHAQAGALGAAALFAAACAVPALVAMRGACIVYRRALLGLSTEHEEQALQHTLASTKNKARELRVSGALKPTHAGVAAEAPIHNNNNNPPVWPGAAAAHAELLRFQMPPSSANPAPWQPSPLSSSAILPPSPPLQKQQQQPWPVPSALDVDLEMPFAVSAAAPLPCPVCGGVTETIDFFCGHCGHALR